VNDQRGIELRRLHRSRAPRNPASGVTVPAAAGVAAAGGVWSRRQMRFAAVVLGCALIPVLASADAGLRSSVSSASSALPQAPVIGGADAKPGKWPDVAALLFATAKGDAADCTGTLVAPTIVLTAAHCADPESPTKVLIGTSTLANPGEGETIAVERVVVFPDSSTTEDVALLVLARPSTRPPRAIATGWARTDIVNGAAVALVGFGTIDQDGEIFVDALQEAHSTITDADCSRSAGCRAGAAPAGELGAGGAGIDTCPGDSGGPLYLVTDYGTFLAGVTSRGYDDATVVCSGGGIYARADKIADWIDAAAGVQVVRGPAPTVEPIVAVHGTGGETRIRVNDPRSSTHAFKIVTPPAQGAARVRGNGSVRVCIAPEAAAGDDELTVEIIDTQRPGRSLAIAIPIAIEDGVPDASCDLDAGGCCDSSGRAGGSIPLALGVVALVLRRRRRAR